MTDDGLVLYTCHLCHRTARVAPASALRGKCDLCAKSAGERPSTLLLSPAEATRRINQILAELEAATGTVVESLGLERIDITTLSSPVAEYATTVRIELARQPGHTWSI